MTVPFDSLIATMSQTFWAMLRIGGFFMVVPVIGSQMVSPRIRMALTFATAIAVSPLLPKMPSLNDIDLGLGLLAVTQVLIGVGLGFTTVVFFQLFTVAGQFIAMQTGLGFASMVDPTNGVSVTVDQPVLPDDGVADVRGDERPSRAARGADRRISARAARHRRRHRRQLSWQIASLGSWMFGGAVLIALPAVTSLLVVNLAFGVMTRAAPQLNIFSLGFPLSLLFGLVIMWVALYGFTPQFEGLVAVVLRMDPAVGLAGTRRGQTPSCRGRCGSGRGR